jgi:hypothetical protein
MDIHQVLEELEKQFRPEIRFSSIQSSEQALMIIKKKEGQQEVLNYLKNLIKE